MQTVIFKKLCIKCDIVKDSNLFQYGKLYCMKCCEIQNARNIKPANTYKPKMSYKIIKTKREDVSNNSKPKTVLTRLVFTPNIKIEKTPIKTYKCNICKDTHKIKTMSNFGIVTNNCSCYNPS